MKGATVLGLGGGGLGLALALALLAGCGTGGLDTSGMTEQIQTMVEERYAPAPVGEVTCPTDITVEVGSRFECTVPIDGQLLTLQVEQLDDQGLLRVEPLQAVLGVADTEAAVAGSPDPDTGEVPEASCGDVVALVVPLGDTFSCDVGDGFQDWVVVLRVENLEGLVEVVSDTRPVPVDTVGGPDSTIVLPDPSGGEGDPALDGSGDPTLDGSQDPTLDDANDPSLIDETDPSSTTTILIGEDDPLLEEDPILDDQGNPIDDGSPIDEEEQDPLDGEQDG